MSMDLLGLAQFPSLQLTFTHFPYLPGEDLGLRSTLNLRSLEGGTVCGGWSFRGGSITV